MRMSVVICAYTFDRLEDVRAAVASVQVQTLAPSDVIVVVDRNPDLQRVLEPELLGVKVVANTDVPGLSGARNTGVAAADGEVVAFLDDDAVARPGWLATLAEHYDHPAVIGVGGAAVPAWDEGRPGWFPPEFDWVVGCSHRGVPTEAGPVRNLIGCNMSFRAEVLARIGGFDGPLGRIGELSVAGTTCDDTEYCIRAASVTGGHVIFEPEAIIEHRVPGMRGTWRYFRRRCYSEGLAKARITKLAGPTKGLSAERDYVTRVLPAAAASDLAGGLRARDATRLRRGGATVAGLTITLAGYAAGLVRAGGATSLRALNRASG